MVFNPASFSSEITFVLLNFAILTAIGIGVIRSYTRTHPAGFRRGLLVIGGILSWISLFTLSVYSEAIQLVPLPALFPLLNLIPLLFALLPVGKRLAVEISMSALVLFHVFRLPLEILLHSWAEQGTIPSTMTWNGQNLDVITSIVALVFFPFVNRRPWLAWIPNITGILLLINVMRVAILSSPLPFSWKTDPPLLLIYYLPYALIVPVCVGAALAGHIVLTRKLIMEMRADPCQDQLP